MAPWRLLLHEVIYEADTRAGKFFDVCLLWLIILSVFLVTLESVKDFQFEYKTTFGTLEWVFTGLFLIEYILRIIVVEKPTKYIFSFFGIVDLLAILPSFIEPFVSGTHFLMIVRSLRLLRVYRVLKLGRYLGEAEVLILALNNSRRKIVVFVGFVLVLCFILGSMMYVIEGESQGFTSIPRGVYWAIVTLTTVGYGDITPTTILGQMISALVMIMGYGVLAVPTGMVGVELAKTIPTNTQSCSKCGCENHKDDARFCRICGTDLFPRGTDES